MSSIAKTITNSVTLGTPAYGDALAIAATGAIEPTGTLAAGLVLPAGLGQGLAGRHH